MFLYVLTGLSEISLFPFTSEYFPENSVEQSFVSLPDRVSLPYTVADTLYPVYAYCYV